MLKAYVAAKSRLTNFQDHLKSLRDDESGAAMIEYALLLGLIAVASVGALTALEGNLGTAFQNLGAELTKK